MHDVRVALDLLERGDLHGPRRGDAPEVVARQIDQHRVLGVLLGVPGQLGRQGAVLFGGLAARPRARDRPEERAPPLEPSQRLRARSDDLRASGPYEVQVGRWIQQAERAVHGERIRLARAGEPHRQDDLIGVPGADMVLRALDRAHELVPRMAGDGLAAGSGGGGRGRVRAERMLDLP